MRKKEFADIFKKAIDAHAGYIGVAIRTEGSSQPEIIINPAENFEEKLKYYRAAYDEDLILVAAKGKKDIRITAVAAGDTFADIEFLLLQDRPDWKKVISEAVDTVVNRMLDKYQDVDQKQRDSWTVILEGFKEQFFKNRYTIGQQRFICENRELYEDMFETCMNGSNEEFKEKFFNLSRELNNHA